jgi:gliding motility-associated-like protein
MFLPTRPNMSIGHCLRTLAWVLPTLAPHLLTAQVTYTFSNTTVAAHDSWNSGNDWSTALVREVVVSGVPTSGMVLRQVNLDLGSAAGSNISTLAARLTDPSGNIIPLFNAGYFYNTDFSRYVNIHLRDHVFLKRLNDYTNSYLGMPYSFGYYRVETPGSFANLNTTTSVNGTWTFSMIENTGTEIQFNSVELVFGPPFTYVDISDNSNNSACAQSQCLQSGASEIVLATNVGYPHNQPAYPGLTVGGCNWNAEANNTAWFHFTATASTVQVSVSGFDNDPQQTIVLHNNGTCAAPSYSVVGCPTSMFVGGCNTTTGHPTLYHRVCYDGGTKFNHGYTLTGLTSGQQYVLVVDGQAGVSSTFYIELTTGADNTCMSAGPVIDDVAPTAPGCDGTGGSITITASGTGLEYSIDGGATFQPDPTFTDLGAGVYDIVVRDENGATATTTITLDAPEVPAITSVSTTSPDCGMDDGSISISATGTGLQYSNNGGIDFQPDPLFTDLAVGTYVVVVMNDAGCTDTLTVVLDPSEAPVIEEVSTTSPACGANDGTISVSATGTGLQYSSNGGIDFQPDPLFTDLAAGTYVVVVVNDAGCTDTLSVLLEASDGPTLDDVATTGPSCTGQDGSIQISATGQGLEYAINGGTPQSSPSFAGLDAGGYTIIVTDANGCSTTTTVQLTAPEPVAITSAQAMAEGCADSCDGSILATASGSGLLYRLNSGPAQGDGLFQHLCPGSYVLHVTNADGCMDMATVAVAGGDTVVAAFTASPAAVGAGQPIAFTNTSTGAASWSWTFGDGNTSSEEHPVFTPEGGDPLTICLTVTSTNGCTDTHCQELPSEGAFDIPNVFSPNGDGVNDTFGVFGPATGITAFSLEIFNRWGQLLFSADRTGMRWDGRQFSGEMAPEGTYFWVLRYTAPNGEAVERTGHLTLVR